MELIEHFKIRYPEFKEVDDKTLSLFFLDAKKELSQSRWGDLYERGLLALVAHFLYLRNQNLINKGQAINPIASKSVDSLSVGYASNSGKLSENIYTTNAYGQEYLRLRKIATIGVTVARL